MTQLHPSLSAQQVWREVVAEIADKAKVALPDTNGRLDKAVQLVLQAAALDRKASVKGGPYSGPVIGGGGKSGVVDVDDDGETVTVTAEGRNYRGEVLFTRTFSRTR